MKQTKYKNKMADMPVKNLLWNMGIPMILSMMLQAVYNIVDSAFVSNMKTHGELAFNALTLAFPVQMFMVALGIGTAVGVNVLLARCLGQGDNEKASRAAGNGVFLAGVIYIAFLIFGLLGVHGYIASQTQNDVILEMADSYLSICCIFSFGIVFFSIFEKLLQATGRSLFSTIAQMSGAVVNIILDPILIYGLCGVPEMGVRGAAYATVIGQVVSALLGLYFYCKKNVEFSHALCYKKPSLAIIKEIYSIGFPAIIAQALMSVMTYALNVIFVGLGENVVTAYGLYYKIQQFILFAAFGLRDAITPVVSFAHGMRDKKRVNEGIRYGMGYILIIMTIGLVAIEICSGTLANAFGLSGETKKLCIDSMHIVSISFIFAGVNIAYQGVFQALGCGLQSLIISICRQLVFVVPVAFGFVQIAKGNPEFSWIVWTTFIIAEGLTAAISFGLMKRIHIKMNI